MTADAASEVDFRSDNVAGVAPEIVEAVLSANAGTATSYGGDSHTAAMQERFCELFEHAVTVLPVSTGIAANALSLSVCSPPYGLIYCHASAHILHRESGAAEFYTGGAKVVPVPGDDFRIDRNAFAELVDSDHKGVTSKAPPSVLSLTQATDGGTVYSASDVGALAEIARRYQMKVHMDGARFANAIASAGCSPADMTWRAGVDILSFGATKGGAMTTDAIVVFDQSLTKDLQIRARRAGQNASKMRFASVQLERYVRDGLWLELASRANDAARRIAEGVHGISGVEVTAPVEANEVFLRLPEAAIDFLERSNVRLYRRGPGRVRLVCRFDTSTAEVEGFVKLMNAAIAAEPITRSGSSRP